MPHPCKALEKSKLIIQDRTKNQHRTLTAVRKSERTRYPKNRKYKAMAKIKSPLPKLRLTPRTLILLSLLAISVVGINEYSFNPLKHHDDKYNNFYLMDQVSFQPQRNIFFQEKKTNFTHFLGRNLVFEVPQPALEDHFEPYYANFFAMMKLNAYVSQKNERIRPNVAAEAGNRLEILKTQGMDFEKGKFTDPVTGNTYDIKHILDSKRVDPLYDFVHHFYRDDLGEYLNKEENHYVKNSGLRDALSWKYTKKALGTPVNIGMGDLYIFE